MQRTRRIVSQATGAAFNARQQDAKFVRPDQAAFGRHIMLSRDLGELHQRLERIVADMPQDPAWQAILQRHGLHTQARHRAMGDVELVLAFLAMRRAITDLQSEVQDRMGLPTETGLAAGRRRRRWLHPAARHWPPAGR